MSILLHESIISKDISYQIIDLLGPHKKAHLTLSNIKQLLLTISTLIV
jgi:hypothetical protein